MIRVINVSFNIFIFMLFFCFLFFIVSMFVTRRFNNRYRKFYSIFLDLGKKDAFLYATLFLNFLLVMYFFIDISSFYYIGIYMILFVNILASLFFGNLYLILVNAFYCVVSINLLWLLSMINTYLVDVILDKNILYLKYLLIVLIILYTIFMSIRKLEIILNLHRNKYGGNYG